MSVQTDSIPGGSLVGVQINRGNDLIDAGILRSFDVDTTPAPSASKGTVTFVLSDGRIYTLPLGGRSIEYLIGAVHAARAIAPATVEHIAWA